MRRRPVRVTFRPSGQSVMAWTGDTLLDAALDHGVDLPHECGGNCTCTTCHIYVDRGADQLTSIEPPEDERLDSTPLRSPRSRLACQAILTGDPVEVTILFDETALNG